MFCPQCLKTFEERQSYPAAWRKEERGARKDGERGASNRPGLTYRELLRDSIKAVSYRSRADRGKGDAAVLGTPLTGQSTWGGPPASSRAGSVALVSPTPGPTELSG